MTHELGHYFGLYHTFEGCDTPSNCDTNGDTICDTNPRTNPTYGWPRSKSSCGNADPIHNYMDYTDDPCIWEFTPEQANRLLCTIENWRVDLPKTCNISYGAGCAGSGGFTPALFVDGCALPSAEIEIAISGGLGGAQAFLLLGLNQAATSMGGGCTLNVTPLLPLIVGPLPPAGLGTGSGSVLFTAAIPATATPVSFTMQAFVSDAGGALGFSNTQGVAVSVP